MKSTGILKAARHLKGYTDGAIYSSRSLDQSVTGFINSLQRIATNGLVKNILYDAYT